MIPTAIIGGLLLGLWLRWWAIPIVAVGWVLMIAAVLDLSSAPAAALLGAVNAAVGVLFAVAFRKLFAVAARP